MTTTFNKFVDFIQINEKDFFSENDDEINRSENDNNI